MIHYLSLKDHVYEYISNRINEGSIRANEKISENRICEDLNISRTPVREALMQLASEGFIEQIPRRGFVVSRMSEERVRELYEVMGCLEAKAAELATERMEAKDLDRMGQLIDEMETLLEEKRYGDYYKQQIRFHEVFIEAGGNRELAALISHQKKIFVMQNYHPTSDAGMFHESLKNGNRGHMEILRLFREKRTAELKAYLEQTHWNFRHANLETLD